jgi:hypothetical protein
MKWFRKKGLLLSRGFEIAGLLLSVGANLYLFFSATEVLCVCIAIALMTLVAMGVDLPF